MSFFLLESDQYPYVYFGGGGKESYFSIVGHNGVLAADAVFTRASTGTTEITKGVFTQAAVNEPRYQYVGSQRGLLIEEAATNVVYPSASLSGGLWTNDRTTVDLNVATSPDGTASATRLKPNTAGNAVTACTGANNNRRYADISVPSGIGEYTLSLWIKTDSIASNVALYVVDYVTDTEKARFITASTSEWKRISVKGTTTTNGVRFVICTSQDVLVWGAQAVKSGVLTSDIPTTSAAATRAADICSITTDKIGFSTTGGAFIATFTTQKAGQTQFIVNGNTSAVEFLTLRSSGKVGTWNGTSVFDSSNTASGLIKSAVSYDSTSIKIGLSGVVSNSSNTFPMGGVNTIKLNSNNQGAVFTGLKYSQKPLYDSELQAETS